MRLDREVTTVEARAAALDAKLADATAEDVLSYALKGGEIGRIALVSSFGAESVVLLHLVARINPTTPVLFLETGMLFAETLDYQHTVACQLGLSDLRVIRPDATALAEEDPHGALNRRDTDACCDLRKTRPLEAALSRFDGWVTGRKRFQSGARAALPVIEAETLTGRLKINPLVRWSPTDIAAHMDAYDLPRHPLVAQGYPSIGCAPCTSRVVEGEDSRSGRWRGRSKDECGIHFVGGRMVRGTSTPKLEGATP